jgi:hypothetical protein
MANGPRYLVTEHGPSNPFAVLGIDPDDVVSVHGVRQHVRNRVIAHIFPSVGDTGPTAGPDVPTWEQVNAAMRTLAVPGAFGELKRRWTRATQLRWNPAAVPGSPQACRPPPHNDAPLEGQHPFDARHGPHTARPPPADPFIDHASAITRAYELGPRGPIDPFDRAEFAEAAWRRSQPQSIPPPPVGPTGQPHTGSPSPTGLRRQPQAVTSVRGRSRSPRQGDPALALSLERQRRPYTGCPQLDSPTRRSAHEDDPPPSLERQRRPYTGCPRIVDPSVHPPHVVPASVTDLVTPPRRRPAPAE